MDVQSFRRALDNIDALRRDKKFGEALRAVNELMPSAPYAGELLVRLGMLLQVVDDDSTLEKVETALRAAETCAPGNLDASIELGHFLYAVRDQPREALVHFEAAHEKATTSLKDALIGKIKCHADLHDWNAVESALDEAKLHFPDDSDLQMLRDEYQSGRDNP